MSKIAYIGPPPGTVFQFAGSVAPTGYLFCDGSSQLRATYPDLFAAIGTTYGSADGTHFTLPDGRGRVVVGLGTHADVNVLGNSDGLAVGSRRPKHKHNAVSNAVTASSIGGSTNAPGNNTAVGGSAPNTTIPATTNVATTVGPQTGAEPTDSAAYLIVNHIIKY